MDGARQPSLLSGFDASRPLPGTPRAAGRLPVARVVLETQVPHLDRPYDYLVPAELDDAARPGVRVRARFGGQELPGFLVERRDAAEPGVRLQALGKVVSPEPVLSPAVLELCRAVAARGAGTVPDVLRAAVPPRMARVEKEPAPEPRPPRPPSGASAGWAEYDGGAAFLSALAAGESPRAVATAAPNLPGGWPGLVADAVAAACASGRGAVVVVPDGRDLDRACGALAGALGADAFARLNADDGATPRYRAFLAAARGTVRVAVGTRNAAFAPVADPGLLVLWDDEDTSHAEPRAPYHHARETLLLRAGLAGAGVLLLGPGRSLPAQRLVASGWAAELAVPRARLRELAPRVVSSSDSFERERDPLLHAARLPALAWRTAAAALERGPVLVQVARTGFVPALRCDRCRQPARCPECTGPLGYRDARSAPECRWCGERHPAWRCPECGGVRLRAGSVGADRTAEELGRAFPGTSVVAATGANPRGSVPGTPALVVATPGAEPVAEGGYAAVLLLDGDRMLARDALDTDAQVLHRWLAASRLARPAPDGGTVVLAAGQSLPQAALVRWDPAGFATRLLAERRALGLPPAVRSAVLSGPAEAADRFVERLELPEAVRVTGPVLEEDGTHRWLLFFPLADGDAATAELRRLRAVASAQREPLVSVRVDPLGEL